MAKTFEVFTLYYNLCKRLNSLLKIDFKGNRNLGQDSTLRKNTSNDMKKNIRNIVKAEKTFSLFFVSW